MPELPEVETIVRGLRACLPGRRIERAVVTPAAAANILRTPAAEFVRALEGASVVAVQRYGKHILLRMAAPTASQSRGQHRPARRSPQFWWIAHLGMTGQLVCEPSSRPTPPHTHARFELQADPAGGAGDVLRYTDIRQFGRMELAAWNENGLPARLEQLGPDPLEITEEEFLRRLRARAARVKSLLLDQRFLRGLGNIYADECLFRAGLRPSAQARRISRARAAALWHAMRSLLEEAIAHGGSSVSDYVDASGQAGVFQNLHQVYGRAGQTCLRCGAALRRTLVAGRGTTFCPRCQRR